MSTLSRALAGVRRRGDGAFLHDFLGLPTPRWTVRANHRLSFLINHSDKRISFLSVIRGWWGARSPPQDRKTRQNHPKPQNRPLGVPHTDLFLDGLRKGMIFAVDLSYLTGRYRQTQRKVPSKWLRTFSGVHDQIPGGPQKSNPSNQPFYQGGTNDSRRYQGSQECARPSIL